MAKGWKLTWKSPKKAMVAEPLELSIQHSKSPPDKVRIEVYESDAKNYEVDDYDNKLTERAGDDKDDLVVTFEGNLAERPGGTGSLFTPTTARPVLGPGGGNDHVVITFEGATKKFTCPIPHNVDDEPADGSSDGGFYEIYAKLFDATSASGPLLATTDAHLVRRRTDVLLAIEPLNQCDATLGGAAMGKMVLEFFHQGNNATADRRWGDVIVGTANGDPVAKTLCDVGCNYVVLTMALRYMRRSTGTKAPSEPGQDPPDSSELLPAEKTWISMFDEFVEPVLDDAFKPFVKKSERVNFSMTAAEINATAAALFKEHKAEWKAEPKIVEGTTFAPYSGDGVEAARLARGTREIPKHWWVPRLVWWVRQMESGEDAAKPADVDDAIEAAPCTWQAHKRAGGTESFAAVHPDGSPVMLLRMAKSLAVGTFVSEESYRVEPGYKTALKDALQLRAKAMSMEDAPADWDVRLKEHLDRGLPAIAHVKSGCYLRDGMSPGGHYILVVGYRKVGGVLRFIINDPAGLKKLQYECFRESDLTPTEAKRALLDRLSISFVVSNEGFSFDEETVNFERTELDGVLEGKRAERVFALSKDGREATVTLSIGSAIAGKTMSSKIKKATALQGIRFSISVVSGGSTLDFERTTRFNKVKTSGSVKTEEESVPTKEEPLKVSLVLAGSAVTEVGARLPRPWERRVNGLVERRRNDSLCALYLLSPNYTWEKGAAQWLVYSGKVQ